MKQLFHGELASRPTFSQSLQCHIYPHFISKLETIHHGFSWVKHLNRHAIDRVHGLYAQLGLHALEHIDSLSVDRAHLGLWALLPAEPELD